MIGVDKYRIERSQSAHTLDNITIGAVAQDQMRVESITLQMLNAGLQ